MGQYTVSKSRKYVTQYILVLTVAQHRPVGANDRDSAVNVTNQWLTASAICCLDY